MARQLGTALFVVTIFFAVSCGSTQEQPDPELQLNLEPSEPHRDAVADPHDSRTQAIGTGTFTVEPVLCAYGESGIQRDRQGQLSPGWVVLIVDVEAPELVTDVEVASLELLDHVTGQVVSATLPIDMRVMSPNQSLDDLSRSGTERFSGRLEPLRRLRLRIQANLVARQTPLRDELPGRTSLCTPEGNCYGPGQPGCCHVTAWDACSLWPSASPNQ